MLFKRMIIPLLKEVILTFPIEIGNAVIIHTLTTL